MAKRTVEQLSEQLLGKPLSALSREERGVLEAIVSRQIVADDAGNLADEQASFGERLSDRVAAVGGSDRHTRRDDVRIDHAVDVARVVH